MAWLWLKELLAAADKIGSVIGPIEDLFVLLKLYAPDPVTGNKVPSAKGAPRWAKKKVHDDMWGLLTGRLSPGEQTEILQEMFPRLIEVQQCDFIISAASMAMQEPPAHASTLNPFNETVAHLKRLAAITGSDDDHTHQLRMKEADSLNLVLTDPNGYPLHRIENALKRQFTNPNALTRYIANQGRQAVVDAVQGITATIGVPSNPVAGTPATGLNSVTSNALTRAKAWRDTAK
jgi:hypothetical protein